MNLKGVISNDYNLKAKYDYYISLGYSEKASEILATVTYGGSPLHQFIEQTGSPDAVDKLHEWLLERAEKDPKNALWNLANPRRREVPPGRGMSASRRKTNPILDAGSSLAATIINTVSSVSGIVRGDEDCIDGDDDEDGLFEPAYMSKPSAFERSRPDQASRICAPSFGSAHYDGDDDEYEEYVIGEMREKLSSDQYEPIEEKGAQDPLTAPTSTFRMTTNTASVGILLNQIRKNRQIRGSQVRIEELLNYFRYQENAPTGAKFRISTEQMKKGENKELLYIHVGAKEEVKDGQNIVLLLDSSGSMTSQNEVTQLAVATIVSKLKAGDRLSLITYSSTDHTIFEGYEIEGDRDKERIMGKLLSIEIDGCTNGSAGIETAFRIGAKYYDEKKNNQVILITDGDLNFGITEKGGLSDLIEEKKKSHLFLSVIGTGLYNYMDDKLEALAKHGNGTYHVVNNLSDVNESINRRYVSLTNIVAKDVKAQVEFNPRFVKKYRLLGYENRALNHADFRDDTVISEPYGSGGYGVALYEITLGTADSNDLKYQKTALTDLDEICTVKVRYKEPLSDSSEEISMVVNQEETSTDNLKLAWLLYCIGEKLRDSVRLDEADRQFYKDMLQNKAYKAFASDNSDELELLISVIRV